LDENKDWKLVKTQGTSQVYQKSVSYSNLKPTKVIFHSEAKLAQLLDILDTNMIQKHKLWNPTFTDGQVLAKLEGISLQYWQYELGSGFENRDFLVFRRVKKLEDGRVIIAEQSIAHSKFPTKPGVIRCDLPYQMRILEPKDKGTLIVGTNLTDIKGWIPAFAVNSSNIDVSLEELSHISKVALDVKI